MTKVRVAVIGAGWWTQGWHLIHIKNNPEIDLVAIVDTQDHPQSKLNPSLESLSELATKYDASIYHSIDELFQAQSDVDGVIICTPHATHYALGVKVLDICTANLHAPLLSGEPIPPHKPIHILMEKPMTTCPRESQQLLDKVQAYRQAGGKGAFLVNHSANYRPATIAAHSLIRTDGKIGSVRHVTAFFASPLSWIFDDPSLSGWNAPTGTMLGNGFGWGQQTHTIAWILHVTGLTPTSVYCHMTHSSTTNSDVSHASVIYCTNGAIVSLSGTSLLPGHAHSDPPVGKRVVLEVYGTSGAVLYSGVDTDPQSGRMEWRTADGTSTVLQDSFVFEDLRNDGDGPDSLKEWIKACQGRDDFYTGADCDLGHQTVLTVAAMYESHVAKRVVTMEEVAARCKQEIS